MTAACCTAATLCVRHTPQPGADKVEGSPKALWLKSLTVYVGSVVPYFAEPSAGSRVRQAHSGTRLRKTGQLVKASWPVQ